MKVLVSEASAAIQIIYGAVIAQIAGVALDITETPQASRDKINRYQYDVIFIDLDLGTRAEACRLLDECRELNPTAKIVLTTPKSGTALANWSKKLGLPVIYKNAEFVPELRRACREDTVMAA